MVILGSGPIKNACCSQTLKNKGSHKKVIIMTQSDLNILETGTIIVRPGQLERVSRNCSCAGVFKSRNPIFAENYDFM